MIRISSSSNLSKLSFSESALQNLTQRQIKNTNNIKHKAVYKNMKTGLIYRDEWTLDVGITVTVGPCGITVTVGLCGITVIVGLCYRTY